MTKTLNLTDSVGQWVTEHPATSRVFEQHRIDYCCGGGRPLKEACRMGQIDAQAVLEKLLDVIASDAGEDASENDFASKSLADMCDSIEATHHEYLKRELPRLTQLVDKVVSVHGSQHAWLERMGTSFQQLRDELVPHMLKEEQILFPAIRTIEQSRALPSFPFGSVDNPIRMMEHEHDIAGQALRDIRAASSDFTLPDGGCNTFRAMLDGLRELEADLHRHIHKENNVLFPRASQLAAELGEASAQVSAAR
ncbi:Iron-sulfur cluster repair protein YtfE [Symmachiella dynata]|uniref:Iron-sulfur cluster repair protein YtfE n=1 Tax=Symmachiella dynata TaxID=2527995 RepID=A0A517ZQK4_9PLAN|nr:iron-sulfur cluster repair di-iron protein [Symmachiella dynata]QDU44772.1 Iron-sulfur cluster repair protein YtfE [Symmachiella dynata]